MKKKVILDILGNLPDNCEIDFRLGENPIDADTLCKAVIQDGSDAYVSSLEIEAYTFCYDCQSSLSTCTIALKSTISYEYIHEDCVAFEDTFKKNND